MPSFKYVSKNIDAAVFPKKILFMGWKFERMKGFMFHVKDVFISLAKRSYLGQTKIFGIGIR